MRLSPNTSMTR